MVEVVGVVVGGVEVRDISGICSSHMPVRVGMEVVWDTRDRVSVRDI